MNRFFALLPRVIVGVGRTKATWSTTRTLSPFLLLFVPPFCFALDRFAVRSRSLVRSRERKELAFPLSEGQRLLPSLTLSSTHDSHLPAFSKSLMSSSPPSPPNPSPAPVQRPSIPRPSPPLIPFVPRPPLPSDRQTLRWNASQQLRTKPSGDGWQAEMNKWEERKWKEKWRESRVLTLTEEKDKGQARDDEQGELFFLPLPLS